MPRPSRVHRPKSLSGSSGCPGNIPVLGSLLVFCCLLEGGWFRSNFPQQPYRRQGHTCSGRALEATVSPPISVWTDLIPGAERRGSRWTECRTPAAQPPSCTVSLRPQQMRRCIPGATPRSVLHVSRHLKFRADRPSWESCSSGRQTAPRPDSSRSNPCPIQREQTDALALVLGRETDAVVLYFSLP
ncbi:hypothetical protein B0T11DRAFT_13928 [Plectosphaerella cucumerina]|jgi:hypothetical protein|uniref:Uncharacterized protein n=1 Tax=Plectosphaerella cucumerina TaxID=40658 RepID=A0A8K0X8H5_9PEZI|nr:hypothetical protein B0T11DRAFT_13928 [Plectosphaerella cucumerina]